MSILIHGGRIITGEQDFIGDILVEGETISAVGTDLAAAADRTIDAAGKYVVPGGIDVHTHLDMPFGNTSSSDDFETGTRAAAFGGTTSIIDFANQSRGMSMHVALDLWRSKAEGKACIDYGFHMTITDLPDSRLVEMDEMVEQGVTTFKMFMAYPGRLMVDDATIAKAMRQTLKNGGAVCIHAEDGPAIEMLVGRELAQKHFAPKFHAISRPPRCEADAVQRCITLVESAGAPLYVVHVSCDASLHHVAAARSKGLAVFGETCPQYLFCSMDDIRRPGMEAVKFVFTPPVRDRWNQEKLWQGLQANALQVVSTDHCPFLFGEKSKAARANFTKIPNGGPGIEHRVQLLLDRGVNAGRFSLNRWVEITSTNPAKLFGMFPQKGTIAPGSDADIVIWDPAGEHVISASTHHMRVDYSMYEGMLLKGIAKTVLSRGEVIIDNDAWLGKTGRGKYIHRQPFAGMWPGRRG